MAEDQSHPEIAFGQGNNMVVWDDSRSGDRWDIYAARVTPAGAILDPNGILVSPTTYMGINQYPGIVFAGSRFFIAWSKRSIPTNEILGRFLYPDGQLGPVVTLHSSNFICYDVKFAPSVSGFLVAWTEELAGSSFVLKARLLSNNGTPVGNVFTIDSSLNNIHSFSLCFDGTNYCATYSALSGVVSQLWGRKYNVNGTPIGSPFRISNSNNSQMFGCVVPGANNRYLNVWSELRSSYYDIYGNIDIQMIGVEESNELKTSIITLKSNPVRDIIQLDGAEGKEALLYDATGRKVSMTASGFFNCQGLRSGIYFVRVSSGDYFKIVKVK